MLIISVILGVIGLVAFAWFAKNWKAALCAILLVVAGLAYQSADLGGYKRRLDEEKAAEISLLRNRLATLSLVTSMDAQRALSDAKLNEQLKDLARDTPKNDSPCLDAAAARRVWAIRGSEPLAATVRTGRVSKLLQRR
jgi:hypothetical protein